MGTVCAKRVHNNATQTEPTLVNDITPLARTRLISVVRRIVVLLRTRRWWAGAGTATLTVVGPEAKALWSLTGRRLKKTAPLFIHLRREKGVLVHRR